MKEYFNTLPVVNQTMPLEVRPATNIYPLRY